MNLPNNDDAFALVCSGWVVESGSGSDVIGTIFDFLLE